MEVEVRWPSFATGWSLTPDTQCGYHASKGRIGEQDRVDIRRVRV